MQVMGQEGDVGSIRCPAASFNVPKVYLRHARFAIAKPHEFPGYGEKNEAQHEVNILRGTAPEAWCVLGDN